MRINGFDQIKALYSMIFSQVYNFKPQHISLYVFLINQNNRNNWVEWFKCPFDLAMAGACIGSKKTYYQCLKDLQDWGLLTYEKGSNEWKSPKIKLEVLKCTATYTATVPQSEPLPIPLPTPLGTHIYKPTTYNLEHIETDKEKPIENENPNGVSLFFKEEKEKPVVKEETFNFQKELEKICPDKQLVKDWLVVRKTKKAANTLTAYRSFLNQVEKSKKPIEEVLSLCIENSWKGFQAEWLKAQNPTFGAKPQIQNHFRSR